MIRHEILPSGLRVIVRELHTAPVVALNLWVAAGSMDDEEGLTGSAHFVEHMLFKRAPLGGADISETVQEAGGYLNAATGCDHTTFYQVIPSDSWRAVLDAQATSAVSPAFNPADVETERSVIVEEARSGERDASRFVWRRLMETAYSVHPCRRPVVGTEETISRVTADSLAAFHGRHYRPANLVQVITGDVRTEEVLTAVADAYEALEATRSGQERALAQEPPQRAMRAVGHRGRLEHARVAMAFHVPHVLHEDVPALDAVCGLLGTGRSCRLRKALQINAGLVSSIGAGIVGNRENGILTITAALSSEDLDGVVAGVFREISRLALGDVGGAEMEKNLRRLEASYVLGHETCETMASGLGLFEIFGDYRYAETYLDRLAAVSVEDVARVSAGYLVPSNSAIVSYAPEDSTLPSGDISARMTDAASLGARTAAGRVAECHAAWSAPKGLSRPAMLAERAAPSLSGEDLACGGRLVVFESHAVPIAGVAIALVGGHVCESAEMSGITYLTQRMLMRGTQARSAEQLADDIENLGGAASPIVDRDGFGLGMSVASARLDDGLRLLGEVLARPAFSRGQLDLVKAEIAAEIGESEDHAFRRVTLMLLPSLFPDHPYGRAIRGTRRTVAGISLEDVERWHASRYSASNVIACVAGDVDPRRVRVTLDSILKELPGGAPSAVHVPLVSGPEAGRERAVGRPGQSSIGVGFGGPRAGTADAVALRLVARALSMMGGRLWSSLREKPPHAYTVSASLASFRNGGALITYVTAPPGQEDAAIESILDEFERVGAHGLDDGEMRRAKSSYAGTHMISLQRSFTRAASYATAEVMGVGCDYIDRLPDMIRAVSNEEIIEVCRRYLNREGAFATAVLSGGGRPRTVSPS